MTENGQNTKRPIVLLILDGWGLSPNWRGNAINFAHTPVFDRLWRQYPHAVLQAYQPDQKTRLSKPTVGSSDISHVMIGSGRVIQSDLSEISKAIETSVFQKNPILNEALQEAAEKKRAVHLIGLASDGGIQSDIKHLEALLKLANKCGVKKVVLHLITDGRDVPPTSGYKYYERIENICKKLELGHIASLIGRAYAMDKTGRWERTLKAYRLWTQGIGLSVAETREAFETVYQRGITDEYLPPILIGQKNVQNLIQSGDSVIVWNVRADRSRQMVQAFVDQNAMKRFWVRQAPLIKLTRLVTLTSPHLPERLPFDVAFPPAVIPTPLAEVLSRRGLRQLRITESEKMAHLTYYFNGGRDLPFPGEDHLILPSPRVKRYDLKPAMATPQIVNDAVRALDYNLYDFVVINLANVDMVGHTGNLFATAEAIKVADQAVERLAKAVLAKHGTLIITSDHGNAEQMITLPDADSPGTHTINPVPFILIKSELERDLVRRAVIPPPPLLADLIRSQNTLADIAPTILDLLGLPIPIEMTGSSLLKGLKL